MEMGGLAMKRYRIDERVGCVIGGRTIRGWIVQMWSGYGWLDITRAYEDESEAEYVKRTLEK